MKTLFPQTSDPLVAAAILIANVYASSGQIAKASDIRTQLHKAGTKKKVGLTWTVTNGKVNVSQQPQLSFWMEYI